MDLHLAVQVLVKVGGVRQLEVLHLPALVARRPDRVDSQDVGPGGGGAGCGAGDSLVLLDKADQDKEQCEEHDDDGEEDGGDETHPAREGEGGGEERGGLRDCQGDVGLLGEEES